MAVTEFFFPIDLHMLEADRLPSHVRLASPRLRTEEPFSGQTVTAVDEDGATYLAVIEQISPDGFVDLRIKLESKMRIDAFVDLGPDYMLAYQPSLGALEPATVRTQGTAEVAVST